MSECNDCDQTPDKCHYNCNNCDSAVWAKDCQSCLKEHDRELKEALEKWGILESANGEMNYDLVPQWIKFWKKRGIE